MVSGSTVVVQQSLQYYRTSSRTHVSSAMCVVVGEGDRGDLFDTVEQLRSMSVGVPVGSSSSSRKGRVAS